MEIVIDVTRTGDGRLAGTARPAGPTGVARCFDGVMELVACVEQLCEDSEVGNFPFVIVPAPGSPAQTTETGSSQADRQRKEPT